MRLVDKLAAMGCYLREAHPAHVAEYWSDESVLERNCKRDVDRLKESKFVTYKVSIQSRMTCQRVCYSCQDDIGDAYMLGGFLERWILQPYRLPESRLPEGLRRYFGSLQLQSPSAYRSASRFAPAEARPRLHQPPESMLPPARLPP